MDIPAENKSFKLIQGTKGSLFDYILAVKKDANVGGRGESHSSETI